MNSAITISTGIHTSRATRTPRDPLSDSSGAGAATAGGASADSARARPHNSHRAAPPAIRAPQSTQYTLCIGRTGLACTAALDRRIHPAAQSFRRTEHRHVTRRNRKFLVRARIARLAGTPALDMKRSKPSKFDAFARLKGLGNAGDEAINDRFRFDSGHSSARGNAFDNI